MTKSGYAKAEEARRKAHAQFAKPKSQEGKGLSDYEKAKQATAAKTARLRALRLEKEAADRASGAKPTKAVKGKGAVASRVEDEDADETVEDAVELGEPGFGADGDSFTDD